MPHTNTTSLHTAKQHKTTNNQWMGEWENWNRYSSSPSGITSLTYLSTFFVFFSIFFSFAIAAIVSRWSSHIHIRLKRRMNFQWAHGVLLFLLNKKKMKQFIIFIGRTDRDKHTGKIFVNEIGKKRNTHVTHRIARTYIRSSYIAFFLLYKHTACVSMCTVE